MTNPTPTRAPLTPPPSLAAVDARPVPRRAAPDYSVEPGAIGGGAPIVVQSMTLTDTHDVEATLGQIRRLDEAGCELVRVAVPGRADADALPAIDGPAIVCAPAKVEF